MRILSILAGLGLMTLATAFQFWTGPETRGWSNLFIFCGGLTLFWTGIGIVPEDPPAPPAPKEEEPKRVCRTPYELGRYAEATWRDGRDPYAYIHCAAQFRAYVEQGRPQDAEEFISGMSDQFIRAIKNGARKIRESER